MPAQSYQHGYEELDLMSIRMSGNTDVIERDPEILAFQKFGGYALIDNRAVSRRTLQRLTQRFGGSRDIIEPSQLSKIDGLSEVKSEQLVVQGAGDEVEKADLMADLEASVTVLDLAFPQTRFLQ